MIRTAADVTPAVIAAMQQTSDPQLRQIMVSLVMQPGEARLPKPPIK